MARQKARGKSEEGLGDFTFLYTVWFYCVHLLTSVPLLPKSLDFGLTPRVELENLGFGIYVREAYAAQRVFFRSQGTGTHANLFNLKSKI
jgi:hypothetical protein